MGPLCWAIEGAAANAAAMTPLKSGARNARGRAKRVRIISFLPSYDFDGEYTFAAFCTPVSRRGGVLLVRRRQQKLPRPLANARQIGLKKTVDGPDAGAARAQGNVKRQKETHP